MRVLIDTNVILDWLMCREPFHRNAAQILRKCMTGEITGYLAAHTFPDLFYILRKDFDVPKRKALLALLCSRFQVIEENQRVILAALQNEAWKDLEDGLQMQCAADRNVDYIITRDVAGFHDSGIPPIQPEDFIRIYRT